MRQSITPLTVIAAQPKKTDQKGRHKSRDTDKTNRRLLFVPVELAGSVPTDEQTGENGGDQHHY